ncbi:MAG: tyrosine-type recombinase/integrase [Candidatus Bathyarchaeia archaeon]
MAYEEVKQRYLQNKADREKESALTLESYPEVQTWLKTVSPTTRPNYLSALRKFCEFAGKTPTELILERDKEIKNPDPNSRTGIRDLILDFREYLEKEGYAPKTINTWDGAVRSFFTAVLGKAGMVNVKNYRDAQVSVRKDLVPTLEELKKMLDVCNLEEKFRIIFLAQTGMRISDALRLKIGDIERELKLGKVPLAIYYLPEKEKETVGERITFLASDGVEILKRYLEWRKQIGENLTADSPLFASRTKRGTKPLSQQKFNQMLKNIAKKAGLNGNGKYGILRAHSLRKFFVTQLTNHGVEDKIVNFFIGHKIPEVDRVYWFRRVEELRKIYAERQQHLNPFNQQQEFDLNKLEDIKAKIEELEKKIKELEEAKSSNSYDVKIATSLEQVIALAKIGYDCQPVGENRWLMRKVNVLPKST